MWKSRLLSFGPVTAFLLVGGGVARWSPRGRPGAAGSLRTPASYPPCFRSMSAIRSRACRPPKQRDGNPLEFGYFVQDLLAKAEIATKKQDHQAAIRYYRALAIGVPDPGDSVEQVV